MTGATFFSRLAKALADNPPYAEDATSIKRLKKLGVEPGKPFDPTKVDPDILKGINKAPWEVWKQFAIGPYDMQAKNGWINMLNLGRYGSDYNTRAFVAYMGLGALPKEDAVYPSAFVDANGTALDGGSKYVMHFEKDALPPSNVGVWSISPYRDNFYVRNEPRALRHPVVDAAEVQRRRIAGRVHPGHLAGGGQGVQLAAVPAERLVQPHGQVLPAQGVPAQRQLRAAASGEGGVVTFQERQR